MCRLSDDDEDVVELCRSAAASSQTDLASRDGSWRLSTAALSDDDGYDVIVDDSDDDDIVDAFDDSLARRQASRLHARGGSKISKVCPR